MGDHIARSGGPCLSANMAAPCPIGSSHFAPLWRPLPPLGCCSAGPSSPVANARNAAAWAIVRRSPSPFHRPGAVMYCQVLPGTATCLPQCTSLPCWLANSVAGLPPPPGFPPKSPFLPIPAQNNNLPPPITDTFAPSQCNHTPLPHLLPPHPPTRIPTPSFSALSPILASHHRPSSSPSLFPLPPAIWKCRTTPVANHYRCHPWEFTYRAPHELTALPSRKPRCLSTRNRPRPKKSNDRMLRMRPPPSQPLDHDRPPSRPSRMSPSPSDPTVPEGRPTTIRHHRRPVLRALSR